MKVLIPFISFFTTLHMFVKQLHNKLWKIQNSSVILDKYLKQDRVSYKNVKEDRFAAGT
jgi:hypothetical protein